MERPRPCHFIESILNSSKNVVSTFFKDRVVVCLDSTSRAGPDWARCCTWLYRLVQVDDSCRYVCLLVCEDEFFSARWESQLRLLRKVKSVYTALVGVGYTARRVRILRNCSGTQHQQQDEPGVRGRYGGTHPQVSRTDGRTDCRRHRRGIAIIVGTNQPARRHSTRHPANQPASTCPMDRASNCLQLVLL